MIDGNEIDAAYEACLTARQNGTKVLYDCGGLYEGVERLLALTDVMIPSEEFALGHTGCETVEAAAKALYERYHPEIVVITCGKKGGILYGRAEGGLREASQEAASGVSVSKGEERKQRRLQTEGTELLSEAYPAFPVEAVDTNGSGDVFHGAFAAAMTRGWNYRECCIFASAVSAIKCTGFGARESVPDYETVMEFLKERGQIGRGRLS